MKSRFKETKNRRCAVRSFLSRKETWTERKLLLGVLIFETVELRTNRNLMMMDSLVDGIMCVTCGGEKGSGFPERANKVVNTCGRKHWLIRLQLGVCVVHAREPGSHESEWIGAFTKNWCTFQSVCVIADALELDIRVRNRCDSLPRVAWSIRVAKNV